ncbi:MAG: iron chaperone [Candidatus Dormibacteria bacterium]
MREYVKERKAQKKGSSSEDGERQVREKIAEMGEDDRAIAAPLHDLIRVLKPDLVPRTWYGMPAYAKDGNVVIFFQPAQKFRSRYATLGFSDRATLDDGSMWPSAYAILAWTADVEAQVKALIARAVK